MFEASDLAVPPRPLARFDQEQHFALRGGEQEAEDSGDDDRGSPPAGPIIYSSRLPFRLKGVEMIDSIERRDFVALVEQQIRRRLPDRPRCRRPSPRCARRVST